MMMFLIIPLLILFFLRVYFYEMSEGDRPANIIIPLFRHMYSLKYFFPLRYQKSDDEKISNYKKTANILLYCFYIVLAVALIYIIIQILTLSSK